MESIDNSGRSGFGEEVFETKDFQGRLKKYFDEFDHLSLWKKIATGSIEEVSSRIETIFENERNKAKKEIEVISLSSLMGVDRV